MGLIILIIIVFLLLITLMGNKKNNSNNMEEKNNIDISKYYTKGYVMTQTELIFYRQLKQITDKLNLTIFPQVDMERIIKVSDNNSKDRNRIKSRSIDFTIVNNDKCKIICCIELDDKSHNKEKAYYGDNLKNEIFKKINIPLYRIKTDYKYNLDEIEKMIKES